MKLDFTELLYALSFALDSVEIELTGVKTEHGKRVAYLSYLMGRNYGLSGNELVEFVGCAILHDNAIAEYIREEFNNDYSQAQKASLNEGPKKFDTKIHCVAGEKNISLLPFRTDVKNIILYHHGDYVTNKNRLADKSFIKSQIVKLADFVDTIGNLTQTTETDFNKIKDYLQTLGDEEYPQEIIDLFMKNISFQNIAEMNEVGVEMILRREVPTEMEEYTDQEIRNIAETFAKIVDYKSSFTKNHSLGVAKIADKMAAFYDFDSVHRIRFYFAAALHDVGKLIIPNDILEKPGKLTSEEFVQMKTHAYATFEVLNKIPGLEDIAILASRHHEKLDGSGYPFGLKEEELSFDEKLLVGIDIYQALTESRPYKDGFSHEKTIAIMNEMVENNQLDKKIVEDLDKQMIS